jgi:CRISPR-associated protein (TIGR03984 family)
MRKISTASAQQRSLAVNEIPSGEQSFLQWLRDQASLLDLSFALAYMEDGIIWGWFDGSWHWSGEVFANVSPSFRLLTLQQVRLFGPQAELLVWRTVDQLCARVIKDGVGDPIESFDESYLLWGKPVSASVEGFTLMKERAQGLRHTPPAAIAKTGQLQVRHYLHTDEDGCLLVVSSRLVVDGVTRRP